MDPLTPPDPPKLAGVDPLQHMLMPPQLLDAVLRDNARRAANNRALAWWAQQRTIPSPTEDTPHD